MILTCALCTWKSQDEGLCAPIKDSIPDNLHSALKSKAISNNSSGSINLISATLLFGSTTHQRMLLRIFSTANSCSPEFSPWPIPVSCQKFSAMFVGTIN